MHMHTADSTVYFYTDPYTSKNTLMLAMSICPALVDPGVEEKPYPRNPKQSTQQR